MYVIWECTKCGATWTTAGFRCPCCPDCEAEEISAIEQVKEEDDD